MTKVTHGQVCRAHSLSIFFILPSIELSDSHSKPLERPHLHHGMTCQIPQNKKKIPPKNPSRKERRGNKTKKIREKKKGRRRIGCYNPKGKCSKGKAKEKKKKRKKRGKYPKPKAKHSKIYIAQTSLTKQKNAKGALTVNKEAQKTSCSSKQNLHVVMADSSFFLSLRMRVK